MSVLLLLGNFDAARGTKDALNVAVDGKLSSRQGSNHHNTSAQAQKQTTRTQLLRQAQQTRRDASLGALNR